MLDNINAAYVQFSTLLSFAFSVVAAVLAIDMYRLLRTAEIGNSWRILCISTVIFAFTLALRLAENFQWGGLNRYQLSRFSEVLFLFGLAYAFYLQRQAFYHTKDLRDDLPNQRIMPPVPDKAMDDLDDLAKYYAEGGKNVPGDAPGR